MYQGFRARRIITKPSVVSWKWDAVWSTGRIFTCRGQQEYLSWLVVDRLLEGRRTRIVLAVRRSISSIYLALRGFCLTSVNGSFMLDPRQPWEYYFSSTPMSTPHLPAESVKCYSTREKVLSIKLLLRASNGCQLTSAHLSTMSTYVFPLTRYG